MSCVYSIFSPDIPYIGEYGSGANDLGYANSAILISLMRLLVSNGTITKDQATEALDDAVNMLGPHGHTISVGNAIRLIQTDMKGRVAA